MANHTTKRTSARRTTKASEVSERPSTRESKPRTKGLKLDKWQEEVLGTQGNLLLCTGRQVGKTTIFSQKASQYMMDNPGSRIIVVSLTEDQAELIISMMLNFIESSDKLCIARKAKRPTKRRIILKNGSQVLSRPVGTTGDAVRGFTGDILIIDEASRMPESVFTAAKPTLLTTGGKIWMCSTPFGKQGYFYESWLNKHDRFKVFHISSEQVIKERPISSSWTETQSKQAQEMLDEEKLDMGELAYRQEYLGEFMDDLRRFFSDIWIKAVCTLKREDDIVYPDDKYYMGLDIARMGDDSGTFEIIKKKGDRLMQVENIVTKKQLTTATYQRILDLNVQWDLKQIGIDAGSGSLGVGIMDFLLKEPSVAKKVIALNNRKIVMDKYGKHSRGLLKEDMHEKMKVLGEMGKLHLLKDEDLILSLKSVQIEHVMKEGQPTKVKIFGRDTHIVEGLTRAIELANSKNINTTISWF